MKQRLLKIEDLVTVRSPSFTLRIPDIRLYEGTTLCIAGPNGSGKSTLLEHIVGLLPVQTGQIHVANHLVTQNLQQTKALIGYIPDDEDWFVKELCAREYFQLLQKVYAEAGVRSDMEDRIGKFAAKLRFSALDTPLTQLSHGNKKKVQLIAGLMHRPQLIIIDELRNGLDPFAIIEAEHIIRQEIKRGACIIAATHDLWWAERIADEVVLLVDGTIALHKTVGAIKQAHGNLEQAFMHIVGQQ